VPLLERLGTLAREQAGEAGVAVGQRQHEQGGLVPRLGDHHLGPAEVALGLPGRVRQRHEGLGLALLPGRDRGTHDAGTAGVVVLVFETLVDSPRRVPLLGRGVPVLLQDPLDDGQESVEDRLGPRAALAERGWLLVVDDLVDGAEVEPVDAGRLTQAQLAGEDAATDLSPGLHVV
jgi:hypothetical protein